MEKSITIDAMFDGRSHHGAFRQHLKHRWKWWLIVRTILCFGCIASGAYMIVLDRFGDTKLHIIGGVLVMMGSFGIMRPMMWQMLHERGLRKHPGYGSKIRYTFTKDGMQMSGKAGSADVPWSEFFEVVETPRGLLIYQNKKSYLWIPNADIAEHSQDVVNFWRNSQPSEA